MTPRDGHTVCALNADVVNYSRLMADDRDATSKAMVSARRHVEEATRAQHGRLVNFVGDNFMAVFSEVTTAVTAAIAISVALEADNAERPPSRVLRFRMGMERGQITVTDGHHEGDALNVAARIQALAQPGGLSVSGGVYRELDEPALRFRPVGSRRLKNIPEPVEVYEFVDLPTSGAGVLRSPLSLDIPALAVLPMHVEGGLEGTFGVVRADIMHRLAQIPELTVLDVGQASPAAPPPTIARYMTDLGVHQVGDQLRLHAIVYDVTTMNVVKAHKISGTAAALFDLSESLAEQVGSTVEVELVVGAPAGLYAEFGDAETIQRVYLGWYHLRAGTADDWDRAVELFVEVRDRHPEIPYGWALSAFANWAGAANGWAADRVATMELALDQAERAREIGDPTGVAHMVESAVLMSTGRVQEATELLDRVIITRPTCDVTFGLEGSLMRYLGRWDESVSLIDTAMRLTALTKPWYPTVKACSLLMGGRTDEAASVAEAVLEHQPNNLEALLVLAAAQVRLGLLRRAGATAEAIHERFPALDVGAWLDANPYQDREALRRWKADLAQVHLVGGSPAPR